MLNLEKTTFIIPVKIEHQDRYRNAKNVLGYINKNFKTNVFIYEVSEGDTKIDFIKNLTNLNIKHWIVPPEDAFHRTKYLNLMLDQVETDVVVNYDIDVILDPENVLECQNLILEKKAEVIYPYELGWGQIQVLETFDYIGFEKSGFDLNFIKEKGQTKIHQSECGHCIFFDSGVYRKCGGENEHFVSYGPEDKERMYRFQTLGRKVEWRGGKYVYHFEHFRGNDSWMTNPFFSKNWDSFNFIKSLSPDKLLEFYTHADYSIKYKTIGNENSNNRG